VSSSNRSACRRPCHRRRTFPAIVAAVTLVATAASAQSPYFGRTDLQTAVAELDAFDLSGRHWTGTDLEGRVVLIEFWATWCAPCLRQIPVLRKLRERYGPERFEVLGVSLNSSERRDFTAWVNRQGVAWPQVHDGRAFNGRVARSFAVGALPASVLIDRRGRVVAANLRDEALERAVAALVYGTSTSTLDAARMPMVKR
jgi:thiol-disulfide isomerase/thioredoxin